MNNTEFKTTISIARKRFAALNESSAYLATKQAVVIAGALSTWWTDEEATDVEMVEVTLEAVVEETTVVVAGAA